jgi:hypothetical protein
MQQPDFLYIYILHMSEYSEIFDTLYTYEKCKLHFESHISQSGGITSKHKLTDLLVFFGGGRGGIWRKQGPPSKHL